MADTPDAHAVLARAVPWQVSQLAGAIANLGWVRFPDGQVLGWPRGIAAGQDMADALTALTHCRVERCARPRAGLVHIASTRDARALLALGAEVLAEHCETTAALARRQAEAWRRMTRHADGA